MARGAGFIWSLGWQLVWGQHRLRGARASGVMLIPASVMVLQTCMSPTTSQGHKVEGNSSGRTRLVVPPTCTALRSAVRWAKMLVRQTIVAPS